LATPTHGLQRRAGKALFMNGSAFGSFPAAAAHGDRAGLIAEIVRCWPEKPEGHREIFTT
jgi:hypothetical protein